MVGETYQANSQLAYNAGPGYNLATGLGSLNVYNLVKEWNVGSGGAADFVISSNPAALTVTTAGGTGDTVLTVVAVNGFNDTVTFSPASCSGLPTGATCAFSASPVNAGGKTTLTITTSAAAATPPSVRPLGFGCWTTGTFRIARLHIRDRNYFANHPRQESPLEHRRSLRRVSDDGRHRGMWRRRRRRRGGGGGGGGGGGTTPAIEPVAVTITGTSTTGQVAHTTTVMLTAE